MDWKFWKHIRVSRKKKVITRLDDDAQKPEPYLIRYNLLSTPWFGIKVHKILISDNDCLHDHPWSFITFILNGGYYETTTKWEKGAEYRRVGSMPLEFRHQWIKWRGPGTVLYRPASMPHRLDLPLDGFTDGGKRTFKPAYTFVINFKRTRDWGFWTPIGWVYWEKYGPENKCE